MIDTRNVVRLVLALAVSMVGAVATAAQPAKIYEIKVVDTSTNTNFLTPSASPGTPTTLKATLRNISPTGNSSFNSGTLKSDYDGIKIQSVSSVKKNGTTPTGSAPVFAVNGQQISVSNLAPIGRGEWLEIEFTAYVASTCATVNWNPGDPPTHYLWTGSNFTGDWFELVKSTAAPAVSYIATISTVTLSPPLPTSVIQNVATSFTATVASGCPTLPLPSVQVTASGTPGVTFSTIPLTGTNGQTTFSATFGALGPASMTVTVTVGGASTTLNLLVFEAGNLACNNALSGIFANPGSLPDTAPGSAGGSRGGVDAYLGTCGPPVNYSVDNLILTNNSFGFQWDTGTQRDAAFHLWANFKAQDVDASTGWAPTQQRVQMGWKYDGSWNPIYIWGIACLAPPVASNYGTVTAASATSLTISRTAVPLPPTDFIIAVNGKRMKVTSVGSGTNWTVTPAADGSEVGAFAVSAYPVLPEVYGLGSVSGTTVTVASRSRDFPPAPFPITIAKNGTDWERMLVTAVNAAQTSLTVTRAHDGRPPVDFTGLSGLRIVSNPLPLIPTDAIPSEVTAYTVGAQSQMCIISDTLSAIGLSSSSGLAQMMRTIEWLDIGDGWINTNR